MHDDHHVCKCLAFGLRKPAFHCNRLLSDGCQNLPRSREVEIGERTHLPQQYTQQLQNTANQYQQGFNNQLQQANTQVQQQMQAGQQQLNNGFQQTQQAVTAQMPQYPQQMPQAPAPTQPSTSWNPFATSGSSLPPARGTPAPGLPSY